MVKRSLVLLGVALLVLALIAGCGSGAGGSYPSKPITVVMPYAAGGGADLHLRTLQPYIKEALGQEIVITYKEGAGGVMAMNDYVNTKADGYTLIAYNLPHLFLQPKFEKTAFKPDDVVPLLAAAVRPEAILVLKDSKFKTLKDLVDYAKQNPGKVTAGNTASFSGNHLTHVLVEKAAGIKMTRVVFDGGAKNMTALLGGQVDIVIGNTGLWATQKEKTRILAVAGLERDSDAPDAPTFKELGFNGVISEGVNLVYALKGTPAPVLETLRAKLATLGQKENLKKDMVAKGIPYKFMDWKQCEDYTKQIAKDLSDVEPLMRQDSAKK